MSNKRDEGTGHRLHIEPIATESERANRAKKTDSFLFIWCVESNIAAIHIYIDKEARNSSPLTSYAVIFFVVCSFCSIEYVWYARCMCLVVVFYFVLPISIWRGICRRLLLFYDGLFGRSHDFRMLICRRRCLGSLSYTWVNFIVIVAFVRPTICNRGAYASEFRSLAWYARVGDGLPSQ